MRSQNSNLIPFAKGVSGNPAGRKPIPAEIKTLAREHSAECVQRLMQWVRCHDAKASLRAAELVLAYGFGRPPQSFAVDAGASMPALGVSHDMSPQQAAALYAEMLRNTDH
jgi:hypothetical protein